MKSNLYSKEESINTKTITMFWYDFKCAIIERAVLTQKPVNFNLKNYSTFSVTAWLHTSDLIKTPTTVRATGKEGHCKLCFKLFGQHTFSVAQNSKFEWVPNSA